MALSMANVAIRNNKFKMAAAKLDVPVSQLLYKIEEKIQWLPACFGVGDLDDAIEKVPSPNRKSEIQDGGCQTRSTWISASTQDSKEIATANPMFSGSQNFVMLSGRTDVGTGSEKFKTAAAKPEVSVSQLIYKIAKKFWQLSACLQGRGTHWCYWEDSHLGTGSEKF
jgi:hypothetical protein